MRLENFIILIAIHATLAANLKSTMLKKHLNVDRAYRNKLLRQLTTTTINNLNLAFDEIEVDTLQCPVGCVCQYAHFNDLPLSRWINYMQTRHLNKIPRSNADTTDDLNENEELNQNVDESLYENTNDVGDLTTNNPFIKQATCILQPENDVESLIGTLPHDLQALILLYTGINKTKTICMSMLKPLNQLNTLEIRGSEERTLRLVFDEPLTFLLHANFELITLLGSDNSIRPKSNKHPSDVFNYKPKSEFLDDDLENMPIQTDAQQGPTLKKFHLEQAMESSQEWNYDILPYDVYVQEVKKARRPHFFGWKHLEVLRVHACELNDLDWEMFDGLDSLQHLSMERNNIKKIPKFTLYGVRNIKTLSLAHNLIQHFHYTDLACLLELESLDLSNNRLHKLSELSFPPFPKLQHVDFQQNPIIHIFPATFWVMNSTRTMYFDSHEAALNLWNNAPFDKLHDLNTLEIGNISVKILQQNMFKGLNSLETLRLRGQILSIEFDAFASLSELLELDMNHCQISEISMDAFIGCHRLEVLNLAYNNISYLPPGVFDDQLQLQHLYLQHNHLSTLPSNVFSLPKLALVRLHDNPWKCSCEMNSWISRITNKELVSQNQQCITDHQTGKKINCRRTNNYKTDRHLAPRCNNYNGRSVFYVLRKQLQCEMSLRNKQKNSMPQWRKLQLAQLAYNNMSTITARGHIEREEFVKRMHTQQNSVNYALAAHNTQDEHNLLALQQNHKTSRTYLDKEISNEIYV